MENKTNFSKGLKNQEVVLKELLAKSLVLFIGIGVIAGFTFGVYLIDVKSSQLVFVEGPSISVVTEKSDFKKGEEINIRIVNSGTTSLTFSDASYGLRITGLSGILMYAPITTTQVISNLEPGDEIKFSWDQTKNDGDTALEGLYKISTKGVDEQENNVEKSTTVTIWK